MKKVLFLFTVVLLSNLNAFAQNSVENERTQREEIRKELKQQIEAYDAEQVTPVLMQKRTELETKISAKDKIKIQQLREKLNVAQLAIKENIQAKKKAQENRKEESNKDLTKRDFHRKKMHRKSHKIHGNLLDEADREQLKELLETYKDDMLSIFESIQPEMEKWRLDKQKMMESTLGSRDSIVKSRGRNHKHMGRHHKASEEGKEMHGDHESHKKHHKGIHKRDRNRRDKAVEFLLMDIKEQQIAARTLANGTEVSIYPNPTSDRLNVKYNSISSGKISLVILDANGKKVFSKKEKVQNGENVITIDLNHLMNGLYYMKMSQGKNEITSAFSIMK